MDKLVSYFGKIDDRITTVKNVLVFVVLIAFAFGLYCFVFSSRRVAAMSEVVYVMNPEGAMSQAKGVDRSEVADIEVRDHVLRFHELVLNLVPDINVIRANQERASKLCDASGRQYWQELNDKGFYDNVVRSSAVQIFQVDSIRTDCTRLPYKAEVHGTLKFQRGTSTFFYRFVSRCDVTRTGSQDASNPHGMMIRGFVGQSELQQQRRNW